MLLQLQDLDFYLYKSEKCKCWSQNLHYISDQTADLGEFPVTYYSFLIILEIRIILLSKMSLKSVFVRSVITTQ